MVAFYEVKRIVFQPVLVPREKGEGRDPTNDFQAPSALSILALIVDTSGDHAKYLPAM